MIKKISVLFFSLIIISAHAETLPNNSATIKQQVTALMEKFNVPGAAVEIYDNGKRTSYYFGVNKDTVFELGSVTEVMTGLLLAQQVDAAKMQLMQPVTQYVPAATEEFADVTLRSLATQTSGLPAKVPANVTSQAQLNAWLATFSADEVADEIWQPSKLGASLLAMAMVNATHKNPDELYRRQISNVLGMSATQLIDAKTLYAAANGLKASAQDMQKFLSAAIGLPGTPESVLYPMRLTQTAFIALSDHMQGLGWRIYTLDPEKKMPAVIISAHTAPVIDVPTRPVFDGKNLFDKTGATAKSTAYIAVLPNQKSGVVILLNKHIEQQEMTKLGRNILASLSHLN